MSIIKAVAVAALAAGANSAAAQGYFDFGRIPGIAGEPTVQIDLGAAMLGLISEATRISDPAAADAMKGIEGVRVYVYEAVDNPQAVLEFIDDTSGTLERDGWERTVFVQEGNEKVRVYTKLGQNEIVGLTLMVFDGEAVFVNVAGRINPAQLGMLMNAVGMQDALQGLGAAGGNAAPRAE